MAKKKDSRRHAFTIEDHDGHEVRGFVKELDDGFTFTLNRLLSESARLAGNYDPDLAQFAALREGVESLKIDGKTYAIGKGKPIPRYYDEETESTVMEAVLGHVIDANPFLVEEERYREAFEDYVLDDSEAPQENPTASPKK